MTRFPIEYFTFSNAKDLPCSYLIQGAPELNGHLLFGALEGPNLDQYKIGYETIGINTFLALDLIKKFFPGKTDYMALQPCVYSMTPDAEFIFEKKEKAIYAFGLVGRGFKHMPYHGVRIRHLIEGNNNEANKYKLSNVKL